MTDLAITPANSSTAARQSLAQVIANCLRRLAAIPLSMGSPSRPAWELTGITRIDRYDTAPWLSV